MENNIVLLMYFNHNLIITINIVIYSNLFIENYYSKLNLEQKNKITRENVRNNVC